MGRIAYGFLFVIILPLLLVFWANQQIVLPKALHYEFYGICIAITGFIFLLLGMLRLYTEGEGLPMNLYPPCKLVVGGIYYIIPHPIYCGFVLVSSGVSVAVGSSAGLWLVTPLLAVGCIALVFGYERPDCLKRFSIKSMPSPLLGLPPDTDIPLSFSHRFCIALAALILWVIAYMGIKALGAPPRMIETRMAWEYSIPILSWTIPVYDSLYILVPLSFLLPAASHLIRQLLIRLWVIISVVTIIYLCIPLTAEFQMSTGNDFFGRWLLNDQLLSSPAVASFPSFHVIWAFLWAQVMYERRKSFLWWIWAIAVSVTCLTTGMHSVADVIAGFAVWLLLRNPHLLWNKLLRFSEYLANSWNCIRIGPLRIINHCIWPGAAALIGSSGIFVLAGSHTVPWVLCIGICGLLGAGVWAQLVEGSSLLSRPFGYYGFFIGSVFGIVLVALLNGPWLVLTAALATVAPFAQTIGRIRCLIQGCCHGHAAISGITVTNPHSRVTVIAHLNGKKIHPTQLYSIIANIPIGLFLVRLWSLGADLFFISGLYCILSGMARFVEEAYRGEPQTMRLKGLPLYQWTAIAQCITGFILSFFHGESAPSASFLSVPAFIAAFGYALFCSFTMGMDFPESHKRFSRLSG